MRIWSRLAILLAAVTVGVTAHSQDPLRWPDEISLAVNDLELADSAPHPASDDTDSAGDLRLMELETSLYQLQSEVEDLGDSIALTTRDKDWKVTAFGALAGEIIYAEQRAVIPSAVLFLTPSGGRNTPTIDVHGKQSSLGLELQGPEICGMQSGGFVLTYFYGESLLEDQQGLFIPRGYAELKNEDWRFAAGALGDIINPRIPGSLDFVTGQGGGNLGAFRGQFRAERYYHFDENAQLTVQTGLGNPLTTSFVGDIRTLVEDNGWPNVESRIMLGLGPLTQRGPLKMRPFEIAMSGLVGQIRRTGAELTIFDVWAIGADARIELSEWCGVKAEAFHGQALGNYNAAVLQIFNPVTLEAVPTTGGWCELYVNWTDSLHSHLGFGIDDPRNASLSPGMRSRNQFSFVNLIWDATKSLDIGVELGRYETDYMPGAMIGPLPVLDNEALVYRTRVRLKF